jgi:hypothetical protein
MRNMIKMMMTGQDGITFDPARVIGYGTVVAGVGAFLFDSIWSVVHTHTFDPQTYGMGFGALCAGIMAVGIGVGAKAHTEPQA